MKSSPVNLKVESESNDASKLKEPPSAPFSVNWGSADSFNYSNPITDVVLGYSTPKLVRHASHLSAAPRLSISPIGPSKFIGVSPPFQPPPYMYQRRADDTVFDALPSHHQFASSPASDMNNISCASSYSDKDRSALPVTFSFLGLDESVDCESVHLRSSGRFYPSGPVRTTLPAWALDESGQVKLTISEVLDNGLLTVFAKDKTGCHHLQAEYPAENSEVRRRLSAAVLTNADVFENICTDVFGNFFIQRMIDKADTEERLWIISHLSNNIYNLSLDRYSCRVVQKAMEFLSLDMKTGLLLHLHNANIVHLSVDQNANHVVQKIMDSYPLEHWSFIVELFIRDIDALFTVAEDKYGCRVIQLLVERLSQAQSITKTPKANSLLRNIMFHLVTHCERLTTNEYANYVIQHVISTRQLGEYRDAIIDKCILRNILSMSQEKYASHVVEKALQHAPPGLLKEMMEEIFDGYVPHQDTKKDALDIMLFHQFGNYVVQSMLDLCVSAICAKRRGEFVPDITLRELWFRRLEDKIHSSRRRLGKYSSGKKILVTMDSVIPLPIPVDFSVPPPPLPKAPTVPAGYK